MPSISRSPLIIVLSVVRPNNNGEIKRGTGWKWKRSEREIGGKKKKKRKEFYSPEQEGRTLNREYVPVIIGRDNDRVASSCLWRDCRSRR